MIQGNIVENSAEDLLLRGFEQGEILEKTGVDVGYHGRSLREKLSGIDRVDYKVDFVKNHYTKQQLLDILDEYANGLDKEEVLHHVGISGINIIRLKVLFDRLGLQEEFKVADSKHRRLIMAGGMVKKYGVDNPFKLQQFQEAGQNTRESKYGAKFTLAKGSVFAKEARKKIDDKLKDAGKRKEINDKRVATLQERYGVNHPGRIKQKIAKDVGSRTNMSSSKDFPDRKIVTDVDVSKMHLSIGKLSTVVKDAQRSVFYEHELSLWNNNAYRGDKWGTVRAFLYANRWKYIHKLPDELTDRMLLRAFRISGLYVGYTSFDNAMMLKVIEKYGITSVYDPCSGWGERMATCGLLGIDYEGCDINERLTDGYNKLIGLIDGFKPLMHINDGAKQDVEHDVDAIITCPPYMDVEIYTDKGAEHYDKDKFTAWWKDVVTKCSATNAKVFAVQTNQACRDIFLSGMEGAGWKLSEELTYSNARVSHFHRTGKSVKHEFESMLVMTR